MEGVLSHSFLETLELGGFCAKFLKSPRVIALKGQMGAGKTVFAKGFISTLCGIDPVEITSPTFQYLHLYENDKVPIAHFDFWRLKNCVDFDTLGLWEYFDKGFCLIEWPEIVFDYLPQDTLFVQFTTRDKVRHIHFSDNLIEKAYYESK